MKVITIMLLASVLAVSVLMAQTNPHSQGQATLTVKVANGTGQGRPITGDVVSVVIQHNNEVVHTLEAPVNAEVSEQLIEELRELGYVDP